MRSDAARRHGLLDSPGTRPTKPTARTGERGHTFQVVLNDDTEFAEGAAVETFTYRIERSEALLIGYNINSNALITK